MLLFSGSLLDHGTPALSDHPDRLARLILARNLIGKGQDPFGWVPTIMGGYPELQFYPPGFALLGVALGWITRTPSESTYRYLVILTYLLPAITVTLLLRSFSVRYYIAALGGVVAGYLAFGQSGTIVGVGFGTLGSRLSLAVAPLVVLAFKRTVEGGRRAEHVWPVVLGLATASVLLLHPYHFPGTVVVVGAVFYRWHLGQRRAAVRAWLALLGGFMLSGVWWAGVLLLRESTVAFNWISLQLSDITYPGHSSGIDWWVLVVGAAVTGALSLLRQRDERFRLARALPLLVLLIALVQVVFEGWLHIEYFDAFRLLDDLFFWTAIVSVIWIEAVPLPSRAGLLRAALSIALGLVWTLTQARSLNPQTIYAPRLESYDKGNPGHLWRELTGDPGRVVFTSTTYPVGTHIFGLTGVRSGREFIGGSSGSQAPMQALFMYGPGGGVVHDLIDIFDDKSIFGIRWTDVAQSERSSELMWNYLKDLGVTQVVTTTGPPDEPEMAMKSRPDMFRAPLVVGDLAVFEVVGSVPGRIVLADGQARLTSRELGPYRLGAEVNATEPSIVRIRVLKAPFWSVKLDGRRVAVEDDSFRQILVLVPPGTHTLEAEYGLPGSVLAGRIVSVMAGLALIVYAALGRNPTGPRGRRPG